MGKQKKNRDNVVPVKKKKKKTSQKRKIGLCLGAVFVLAGLLFFVAARCRIHTIVVTGNETYTQDEVETAVLEASMDNTIFYTVLAHFQKNDYLPFIERSEVTFLGRDAIKVEIHEKLRAGVLKEMSEYFYFDKDGVIREESPYLLKNVPMVSGLKMNDCVLNEEINPREQDVFPIILKITQLIIKYDLAVQEIQFNTVTNIRLKINDLSVKLGASSELDAKIAEIPSILKELSGRKGTVNMENYSEDKKIISFVDDEAVLEENVEQEENGTEENGGEEGTEDGDSSEESDG